MQPPQIRGGLIAELEKLKQDAEAASRTPAGVHPTGVVDEYTTRIRAWTETMTPQQRQRRFTLREVMTLAELHGRFRPAPSGHCTGTALRRCGFKCRRDWTAAGRNRRYWIYQEEQQ